jgi:large subunit ribosomal protein L3
MISAILGTKIRESQTFDDNGERIPITRILVSPCYIVHIKTRASDGYNAVQFGFGKKRTTILNKTMLGYFKKAGLDKNPPRFLREIRLNNLSDLNDLRPGMEIKIGEVFNPGDIVSVSGISKGKGFQGVVKRHHFKGGPRTHGQSDRERAPGAIGSTTTPGRVYKGKRMAGRMGQDRVTVKNLKVVNINSEKNTLTISGLVPGGKNSLLVIKKLK